VDCGVLESRRRCPSQPPIELIAAKLEIKVLAHDPLDELLPVRSATITGRVSIRPAAS